MRHAEHHLDGDLDAPARSRRLIEGWTSGHPRRHEIVLALSELVANAVIHAAETKDHGVSLRFDDGASCLRVAVRHRGRVFEPKVRDQHGGLTVVANSVDRWGIVQRGPSVEVWFEVDHGTGPGSPALTTTTRPRVS
jgi:two-component sensor histidine kinase